MKSCLALLSLLLLSYAAAAQVPDSATGRRRLDHARSFAGLHLAQEIDNLTQWQQSLTVTPVICRFNYKSEKTFRLYGCRVLRHHVLTKLSRKIFEIGLNVTDSVSSQQLLRALQARYGVPTHDTQLNIYYWHAERTSLKFVAYDALYPEYPILYIRRKF